MQLKFYQKACSGMKLFLVSLAVATAGIAAAQPANDNCSGATLITPATEGIPCTPVSGNTVNATTSGTIPYCWGTPVRDVWYRFVATGPSYNVSFSSVSLTSPLGILTYAYGLTAYSGNCSALTLLSSSCGSSGSFGNTAPGMTITGLIPGETYYIQVWFGIAYNSFFQPVPNDINYGLCVAAAPAPPVNDVCSGALPIFGTTPIAANTNTAGDDPPVAINCGSVYDGYYKGLWYKLTPAQSGDLTIAACGSTFDTYLRVYAGDNCASFTECAGSNDDSCGIQSIVNFTAVANTVYYILVTGIAHSESGNLTLAIDGVPLEVKMSALSGKITGGNQAQLSWSTYNERNNKGFEIQRSADGKNFAYAGFVPSLGTKGNSNTEQAYSFTDPAPATGRLYYRLKQTDYDNRSSYSNTISLATGATTLSLIATPNPVRDRLNIRIPGKAPMARIQITDLSGKVCRSIQLSDDHTSIDVSSLASGIYLLKYTDALQTQTIKIQKQ